MSRWLLVLVLSAAGVGLSAPDASASGLCKRKKKCPPPCPVVTTAYAVPVVPVCVPPPRPVLYVPAPPVVVVPVARPRGGC